MNEETRARDPRIDALRSLGLSLIILAHVSPPRWLFEARNFGAPMMVLLSGLCFALYGKQEDYPTYLWRRLKRLLFPVWIFPSLYFPVVYLARLPFEKESWKVVLDSYALMGGVGYLWIIRVLLIVTLAAPVIAAANAKVRDDWKFLAGAVGIFAAYEAALHLARPWERMPAVMFVSQFVYYGVAFGLVFAVGMRIARMRPARIFPIAAACLIAYAGLGLLLYHLHGHYMSTQAYKYPPSAYYLAYGLGMATLTLALVFSLGKPDLPPALQAAVSFVARNSLWIYLWHIPLTKFLEIHSGPSFVLRFGFVFLCAAGLVWIQVRAVERFLLPRVGDKARRNARILLTG